MKIYFFYLFYFSYSVFYWFPLNSVTFKLYYLHPPGQQNLTGHILSSLMLIMGFAIVNYLIILLVLLIIIILIKKYY